MRTRRGLDGDDLHLHHVVPSGSEAQADAVRARMIDSLGLDSTMVDECGRDPSADLSWSLPVRRGASDPIGDLLVSQTLSTNPSIVIALATTCTDDQILTALRCWAGDGSPPRAVRRGDPPRPCENRSVWSPSESSRHPAGGTGTLRPRARPSPSRTVGERGPTMALLTSSPPSVRHSTRSRQSRTRCSPPPSPDSAARTDDVRCGRSGGTEPVHQGTRWSDEHVDRRAYRPSSTRSGSPPQQPRWLAAPGPTTC